MNSGYLGILSQGLRIAPPEGWSSVLSRNLYNIPDFIV